MTQTAQPYFQALSGRGVQLGGAPSQDKPSGDVRDPHDYYPTPSYATDAFIAVEGERIAELGGQVWEPAVGEGHMAKPLRKRGFDVIGSDLIDRGYPGAIIQDFYDFQCPPAQIIVTNPPYQEISSRHGGGKWLRHIDALGVRYAAMLLNWDWLAGRMNGMDELHTRFPVSRAYLCCFKVDFKGEGSPPQRSGWLVWDRDWRGETVLRRLSRCPADARQGVLFNEA